MKSSNPITQLSSYPNFSIIIPNLNGAKFLSSCLNSLLTPLKLDKIKNFEIILVDNASTDNSILEFKKIFTSCHCERSVAISSKPNPPFTFPTGSPHHSVPRDDTFTIIKNNRNLGFAKAVNQGILKAKYNYVVICNNDLTVDKNWFKHISLAIKTNKDPKVITFFGTVLNKNGTRIESRGLEFFYCGKALNIDNNKKIKNLKLKIKNYLIWGSSASIVCYHKPTLLKIGMFDPDFFAYEEDVDLALRLHNLKYKTLFVPKAISYHIGGATSSKMGNFRHRMDAKNWFYIIIKNYSKKEILNNLFPIIDQRLRNLSGLTKQTIKIYKLRSIYILAISLITTYSQVILNLPKMLKKRKQVLLTRYNKA